VEEPPVRVLSNGDDPGTKVSRPPWLMATIATLTVGLLIVSAVVLRLGHEPVAGPSGSAQAGVWSDSLPTPIPQYLADHVIPIPQELREDVVPIPQYLADHVIPIPQELREDVVPFP
jgi:hypothetical protein